MRIKESLHPSPTHFVCWWPTENNLRQVNLRRHVVSHWEDFMRPIERSPNWKVFVATHPSHPNWREGDKSQKNVPLMDSRHKAWTFTIKHLAHQLNLHQQQQHHHRRHGEGLMTRLHTAGLEWKKSEAENKRILYCWRIENVISNLWINKTRFYNSELKSKQREGILNYN